MIFHSQQKHSILAEPRFGAIVKNLGYSCYRLVHLRAVLLNKPIPLLAHRLNAFSPNDLQSHRKPLIGFDEKS